MDIDDRNPPEQGSQQRVEESAEAVERLRSILDHVIDGTVTIDEHGTVTTFNPAAEKIFGYSASEVIGKNVKVLMPEPFHSQHDSSFANYVRTGHAKIIGIGREVVGLRKDGSTFPLDLAVSAFHLGERRYFTGIVRDISERKRAEAELRLLNDVVEQSTQPFAMTDLEGRILRANGAFERLTGYNQQELQHLTYQQLTPERWHEMERKLVAQARATGQAARFEKEYRKKDDSIIPIEVVMDVRQIAAEEPPFFCKFVTDISERKRAESELRKIEEWFQELTQNIHQVLWMIDVREAKVLYVSPAYEEMFGRSCQSLINNPQSYMESIHPLDLEMVQRENAGMYQTGHVDVETRILRPDGSMRWVWIRGYPVIEQGHIVRLVGVAEDVTDKRRLAAERDALLSRLQLHIERMPLAYILFDADFRIIDWNPAAERIFGYTRAEAIGKQPNDLNPPSIHQDAINIMARIRAGDMMANSVNENLTKDGRKIVCEWFNTPLMTQDNQFHGLLCLGRDVTEQKSMEAQFHRAQKMEAVGQLAGGVAHDFNNLLTIISGYSELLLMRAGPSDPIVESVKAISEAGQRAASLTRQLLAFSRKTVLEPRVLELNEVVRETEKLLRRLIGEDILLTTVLGPTISRVKVDPGQLGQVLMNLAVNARDAMPKGGKLTVETHNVELEQDYARLRNDVKPGRYVLLSITDTGSGMSPEVKARIFEPFFTTKGVGKGTGLGLAVVMGIVKQSGGHVEVYSEPDIGTTFKIYIPVVAEEASTHKEFDAAGDGRGTETIMLVEDEDGVRGLASLVLQSHGYTVLAASNGKEAMRMAEKHHGAIDLLVTDVVMPGMGGPDLAEAMRPRFPQMKVLFSSGYTDDAVVRHGLLQEKVAFLQKPYSPLNLVRKVRRVLDEK